MSSLGSGVAGAARGAFGGFLGGAGLGPIGGLMGAMATGSITGMAAAVGTIIGMATKMAYEFERSSTRAAQSLSIGMGGNLQNNIATLKKAALGGAAYNISSPEMMEAMRVYGNASGAGVNKTAAAGSSIALYTRAFGMDDPAKLAAQIGGITAMSQRDARSELGGIFSGMEGSGPLGRRTEEFIGLATSSLAAMQARNPSENFTAAQAAGHIAAIASGQTGYFNTSAGVNAMQSAGAVTTQGLTSNLFTMSRALSAGITDKRALLLGLTDYHDDAKMLRYANSLGGAHGLDSSDFMGQLKQNAGGNVAAAGVQWSWIDAYVKGHGNDRSQAGIGRAIDAYESSGGKTGTLGKGVKPEETEEQKAIKRMAEYAKTVLGGDEKLFTDLENKQLQIGEKVLETLSSKAGALDKILNGDFSGGLLELVTSNKGLVVALGVAATAAIIGGGPLAWAAAAVVGLGAAGVLTADTAARDKNNNFDINRLGRQLQGKKPEDPNNPDVPTWQWNGKTVSNKQILAGISGPETGDDDPALHPGLRWDKLYPDSAAGALGKYQVLPTTARPIMERILRARANGLGLGHSEWLDEYGTKDAQGHLTLSEAGKIRFRNDPGLQQQVSLGYISELQAYATAHHMSNRDPRNIFGAYYAGPEHMGQPDWVAGSDQPGNTNTKTERQYSSEAGKKMMIQIDHDADVLISAKTKPQPKKAATGSGINNGSRGMK